MSLAFGVVIYRENLRFRIVYGVVLRTGGWRAAVTCPEGA